MARWFQSGTSFGESHHLQFLSCQRVSSCREPAGSLADQEQTHTSEGFHGSRGCQHAAYVRQRADDGLVWFSLRPVWNPLGTDGAMEGGDQKSDAVHTIHHAAEQRERIASSIRIFHWLYN